MLQEDESASEKHIREILMLALSLYHRLLNDNDPVFGDKISHATRRSPEPIKFPIPSPYQIPSL
ncbi:clathrin assembly protein [Pyrus ussuriensis x Pyrus communis]|uniref:Clathrin assembly protein n=1 Tax=Pyrus ussuriensis x Pyrus communis TaxID=2448454 RepID=A0A5N5FDS7_9ROSA|nr:clathrin assembly protein [Pyrus ussuriensis x Pyrus communis]